MYRRSLFLSSCALAALPGAAVAQPAVVPAQVVVKVGDVVPGAGGLAIATLGIPFATPSGGVAASGSLTNGRAFLYADGQIIWTDTAQPAIGAIESGIGVGPQGEFVLSPVARPGDQLITEAGPIATVGGAIPGYPGQTWLYLFRPGMSDDGTIFFFSSNGNQPWSLWKKPAGGAFVRLYGSGDNVGGPVLGALYSGSGPLAFSPDGRHVALAVTTDLTGPSLLINGAVLYGFGSPTGSPLGDTWRSHTGIAINNQLHYVHYGRSSITDGRDYFIAWNGRIRARSLDVVGTRDLIPAYTAVAAAGLNGRDIVAALWDDSGHAVYAGHGPVFGSRAVTVIKGDDMIDVDGDGVGDYNANVLFTTTGDMSGPPVPVSDGGDILVLASLQPSPPGVPNFRGILRIAIPVGYRCPADFNHDGRVDPSDVAAMVRDWFADAAAGTATTDYDLDDAASPGDVSTFVQLWFGALTGGC